MGIINENAVLKHVPNINLKNAIRMASRQSKLDLQIVLTPEQEAQFVAAQTSKKPANFEHILIAARRTNGKGVDLENVALIKTLSNVAAKFGGEIVYVNGFLQPKTAKALPELTSAPVIKVAQVETAQDQTAKDETAEAEQAEAEPKKAKESKKK
jgi:hypothetical protein